jgi:hypothetical protein
VYNTLPFNPDPSAQGGDYNADGYQFDYPDMPSTNYAGSHTRHQFLTGVYGFNDFPAPTVGTRGNFQRNAYRNPGFVGFNASVIKENKLPFLAERATLQLRFEFFNLFNHPNLGPVDGNMGDSTFGQVTSQQDPRVIQVGGRIQF